MLATVNIMEHAPTLIAEMNEALAAQCEPEFHAGLRAAMPRIVALLIEERGTPIAERAHELRMVLREHLHLPKAGSAIACDHLKLTELARKIVHEFNHLTNQKKIGRDSSHWFG